MIFCRTFFVTRGRKNVEESFGVSFSFGYRKSLCIGWVYHDTLPKFFSRTVPKKIVEESFSVSLISVNEKFYE